MTIDTPAKERLEELFDVTRDGQLINRADRSSNSKRGQIVGCANNKGYLLVRVDITSLIAHALSDGHIADAMSDQFEAALNEMNAALNHPRPEDQEDDHPAS